MAGRHHVYPHADARSCPPARRVSEKTPVFLCRPPEIPYLYKNNGKTTAMRRKGFFRGALWALLIGNIFQLIYTLHDGQANRTIYLGWNQYLFYAGAACLLFGRHKEETNAEKTSAGETSTEETSDAKTLLCFINGVIGLFGILYVECTEDRPGIKCVRHDSWQILQPTPNHPEDYLIQCYRNGNFYEGMTRIYTYGSGRRKEEERKRDGLGHFCWNNGDYYIGMWKEGYRTQGLYIWAGNESAYFGDFKYDQDSSVYQITGRGIYFYPDGSCFDGNFNNAGKEGWGYSYGPDGQRLYARFEHNQRKAYKELTRKNSYVGWFKNKYRATGFGRYYYADGGYYQGWFKSGNVNGEGRLVNAQNKTVAVRKWNMANPQEEPARLLREEADSTLLPNGPTPKAEEKQADAHKTPKPDAATPKDAFITQPDPSGRKIVRYRGKLVNGKPEGKAQATFENGDVYVGEWRNGLREGYGEIRYANGDEYKGEWKADKRTGEAHYFKGPNDYVKGDFVDGKPHGIAIRYVRGARIFNGKWENGVPTKGITAAE